MPVPTRTSRGPGYDRSVGLTTVKPANILSKLSAHIGVNAPLLKELICLTCRGRTADQGFPSMTCRLSARGVAEHINAVASSADEVTARHSCVTTAAVAKYCLYVPTKIVHGLYMSSSNTSYNVKPSV